MNMHALTLQTSPRRRQVNLDLLQFFSLGCWGEYYQFTFYHSLFFSTLTPIGLLVILAAVYRYKVTWSSSP